MQNLISTYLVPLPKESAMAHYAHPSFAPENPQPRNASPLLIGSMGSAIEEPRTLAGMLLAAAIAALMVFADQVIDTWTTGHLLFAWVILWTVAFMALALLAAPLRRVASRAAQAIHAWVAAMRQRRLEARMWEFARHDPRVMAELLVAASRDNG